MLNDEVHKTKEKKAFNIMGAQAWLRAFNGPLDLVAFLPQAIYWTMAKKGRENAAARFVWVTKWRAHIVGWMASLGTIYLALDWGLEAFDFGKGKKHKLMAPGGGAWDDDDDWGWDFMDYLYEGAAITAITIEVIGWILYYFSWKNSMAYGESLASDSLAAAGEDEVNEM